MKSLKYAFALLLILLSTSNAMAETESPHTEDNEIVCQFSDFFRLRLFVDADTVLDRKTGISPKIIEMATRNAHGYTNRLLQVDIIKVQRPSKNLQVILYHSAGVSETITKLEVTPTRARMTTNVDRNGKRLPISFVEEARCEANEPY